MEQFTLINKGRSRLKVFETCEDISKPSPKYWCNVDFLWLCFKRTSKPVLKGSRIDTVEEARKEYKQLLDEG